MLRFFSEDYSSGRQPIDMGLLVNILAETMKITANVNMSESDCKKTILLFLAGINYYFYLHPEQYVDFGKFVAYRGVDKRNLWTMEVKPGETAHTIYDYFKQGGLEVEEVQQIVQEYTTDLLDYSTERMSKLTKDISNIESLVSQDND